MHRVQCAKCKQVLQVAADLAGKLVRCSACGQVLLVPAPVTAAPPPPPPPAPPRVVEVVPEPELPLLEALEDAPAAGPRRGGVEGFPQLGRVLQEFRPRRWWVWLLVSGLLLAACLLARALLKEHGQGINALTVVFVFVVTPSAGIVVLSLGFGAWAYGRRVLVCEHGLLFQRPLGAVPCVWGDVETVAFGAVGMSGGNKFVLLELR